MNRLSPLGAMALTLTVVASASASITVSTLPGGDTDFLALTSGGTLERAVAEGRIGNNNATSGTWERAIWEFGGVGTPKATGGTTWSSGQPVGFSFSFDGVSTATFVLGGQSLSWNMVAGTFTDIFIRTRNARNDTSIELTNLSLTGFGSLGSDLISTTVNEVDYLRVSNSTPFGAMTISGDATLSWTGTAPANSAQAFQVKFSNVIPGPGAAGVLALGGLIATRRRR